VLDTLLLDVATWQQCKNSTLVVDIEEELLDDEVDVIEDQVLMDVLLLLLEDHLF